jgi:glycosyltransferase involved in cell wall biosynthesis
MSKEQRISIIIPTYNSENNIRACLESITVQEYNNIEVVVMDACSSDNTVELVNAYNNKLTIVLTSETDKGIYDAMNKGIRNASGDWVLFMGSDDTLYSPSTLSNVFGDSDYNKFQVIYGDVVSKRFNGRYGGEFNYRRLFKQNICHQAIFHRITVFDKLGYFDTRFKNQADWEYNFRWMGETSILQRYVNEIICNYNDQGISSTTQELLFPFYREYFFYVYGKKHIHPNMRGTVFFKAFFNLLRIHDLRALSHLIVKLLD